jgi:hypothetical protein
MEPTRSLSAHEQRLLWRGIFGNVANVVEGSWRENVAAPAENKNYPKAALGIPVTLADTLLTAPDAALAGIVGQDIEPLKPVTFARTRRDVGLVIGDTWDMLKNVLSLRPGKALKSAAKGILDLVRLPGDLPMDGINTVTGTDVVERQRAQTRGQLLTLAA